MRTAVLLTVAALLLPSISARAQFDDPDAAYYAGQEEQREIDADRQVEQQIRDMQTREAEKDREDTERQNREAQDYVREQELQHTRDELTDMQTRQMLRQSDDQPR